VNVTALLGPLGVVTVTALAVTGAVVGIWNTAVTVVEFTTTMLVTVTLAAPTPPGTVTAVVPVRLVPVMVTGTLVP